MHRVTGLWLAREGYAVDGAGSLTAARSALVAHTYGAVLLDVMLPDGTCYELLRSLKSDPACRRLRVLLLSGLNGIEDYLYGYAYGADDYIGKPFEFADLVSRVRQLC